MYGCIIIIIHDGWWIDMISLAQRHALLSEVGALSNPVVCPPMAMLLRQGLVVGELEASVWYLHESILPSTLQLVSASDASDDVWAWLFQERKRDFARTKPGLLDSELKSATHDSWSYDFSRSPYMSACILEFFFCLCVMMHSDFPLPLLSTPILPPSKKCMSGSSWGSHPDGIGSLQLVEHIVQQWRCEQRQSECRFHWVSCFKSRKVVSFLFVDSCLICCRFTCFLCAHSCSMIVVIPHWQLMRHEPWVFLAKTKANYTS